MGQAGTYILFCSIEIIIEVEMILYIAHIMVMHILKIYLKTIHQHMKCNYISICKTVTHKDSSIVILIHIDQLGRFLKQKK
jgi:hypothetical protein